VADSGVSFHRVWKRFRRGERHNALRDLIPAILSRAVGSGTDLKRDEFWALQDVSFEVPRGEAFGIIGPNGAGKSTVLKLLTKIMRPTAGTCELRGRVGALIEVSAGFHQDLSGRENVFLQGAIMGMKREEVARKFEQIVDFSGVSDFIDTPVRHYSSGMNARLGFSVAAHLDPEILIIDEVLAVGDRAFQQKAYDRIQEIVNRDITVVLVSHQLERVAQLCSHAVLLSQGEVACAGPVDEVISAYVRGSGESTLSTPDAALRYDRLDRVSSDEIPSGDWLTLALSGVVLDGTRVGDTLGIGIVVRSMASGAQVFSVNSDALQEALPASGSFVADIELQMNVTPGLYSVHAVVKKRHTRRTIQGGPWVSVRVSGATVAGGVAQMNPRIKLRGSGPPGAFVS
jgi:lipopolysaccharide transport system ATP-binding protein